MRTAIDTNIISALWSREPMCSRAANLLMLSHAAGGLVICGPVYAELRAHPAATEAFVDGFLRDTNIMVDFVIPELIWRDAAGRFAAYAARRRESGGGHPKRLLVDFLVGAHALASANRLITFDAERYRGDFPDLRIDSQ